MNATECKMKKLYRVTQCPKYEYLTIGAIYLCGSAGAMCIALHRPHDGSGTYLSRNAAERVTLEEVQTA